MNKIFLNYLLKNFLKTFLIFVLVFYCFGVILNLFEEVEFFKNLNVSFTTPLIMTSIFIPSMIINILPFVIFISSIWFVIKIKNNKDEHHKTCPILLEDFKEGDNIVKLPCNHCFFPSAIKSWLENEKAECPVCRYTLKHIEIKNEKK